ncbi:MULTISPECIES: HAD-IIIC family phosphatase [unclassified Burkholderia]|uniref:HAD-IIIC family phosphatase n=1 Tax=Burkholderia sp. LMG 13014 TaxID=2709306 RepID=UPI001640D4C0|nr:MULTISPECIES: HAD-IIIC family phosphatase [unclassified Burkholderia]
MMRVLRIDFRDEVLPCTSSGICSAESFGRWTDGTIAKVGLPAEIVSTRAVMKIEVNVSAFISPSVGCQRADVLLNGVRAKTLSFNEDNKNKTESIYFKVPKDGGVGRVTLEFIIHHPTRPMDVDHSLDDSRSLGLALKSLDVYQIEAGEHVDGDVLDLGLLTGAWYPSGNTRMRPDPKWMFPSELDLDEGESKHFAVIGTCTAEMLTDIVRNTSHKADHFLMNSWLPNEIPDISGQHYDAVLVQLTLRFVLYQVISRHEDDLMHVKMSEEEQASILRDAGELLEKLVNKFMSALPAGVPVFFTSFIEPIASHRGVFWNNRKTSLYVLVRSMNDRLAEILDHTPDGYYVELNDLRQHYGDMFSYDGYFNHFTHAANDSSEFYLALISRVDQALRVLKSKNPIKLIVTDLDNTLWKGVLAEEDEIVSASLVEGWPLGYAEALLECKRRGILLAISSKNDEKFILENFSRVWGSRISLEDFCSIKVNWGAKSDSIKEILREVNVLPQNVLFIDDNPAELDEVRRAFPEMRMLTGDQRRWRMILHYSPETQVSVVTDESKARTGLIRAKIDRELNSRGVDRQAYLQSLEIRVKPGVINRRSGAKYVRSFELLNKTNQFNTTGKRWTEQECEALFAAGGEFLAFDMVDKHAGHGIVAVAVIRDSIIEQVVMSCRVFGLGVEVALLNFVMTRLLANHDEVKAIRKVTERNVTCRNYFSDAGFHDRDGVCHGGAVPELPAWIALTLSP